MYKYTCDQKNVIVYAGGKQLKNYLKKVEREIDEEFDGSNKPEIIICEDVTGVITFPLELDNEAFRKGFAKIAIGFASKSGVDREVLNLALDSDLGKIKDDIRLLPFYLLMKLLKEIRKIFDTIHLIL
jgi:hypothetical protein